MATQFFMSRSNKKNISENLGKRFRTSKKADNFYAMSFVLIYMSPELELDEISNFGL